MIVDAESEPPSEKFSSQKMEKELTTELQYLAFTIALIKVRFLPSVLQREIGFRWDAEAICERCNNLPFGMEEDLKMYKNFVQAALQVSDFRKYLDSQFPYQVTFPEDRVHRKTMESFPGIGDRPSLFRSYDIVCSSVVGFHGVMPDDLSSWRVAVTHARDAALVCGRYASSDKSYLSLLPTVHDMEDYMTKYATAKLLASLAIDESILLSASRDEEGAFSGFESHSVGSGGGVGASFSEAEPSSYSEELPNRPRQGAMDKEFNTFATEMRSVLGAPIPEAKRSKKASKASEGRRRHIYNYSTPLFVNMAARVAFARQTMPRTFAVLVDCVMSTSFRAKMKKAARTAKDLEDDFDDDGDEDCFLQFIEQEQQMDKLCVDRDARAAIMIELLVGIRRSKQGAQQ